MRRAYLREAAVTLVLARLAVRLVPASRIFGWADRPPRHLRRFAINEASWVVWAVAALSARRLLNADCLPRALATHAMLRRRGIRSRLCLGVAREHGEVVAHAWVELGEDRVVIGGEADAFVPLAQFGGA
jgi:hypothetical protein